MFTNLKSTLTKLAICAGLLLPSMSYAMSVEEILNSPNTKLQQILESSPLSTSDRLGIHFCYALSDSINVDPASLPKKKKAIEKLIKILNGSSAAEKSDMIQSLRSMIRYSMQRYPQDTSVRVTGGGLTDRTFSSMEEAIADSVRRDDEKSLDMAFTDVG